VTDNTHQIRVYHHDQSKVVGSGFLVDKSSQILVTCAHVITTALDSLHEDDTLVGKTVWVDFPFIKPSMEPLKATVMRIRPKQVNNSGDIAILHVSGELPTGVEAARLARAASYTDQPFSVFGYPDGLQNEGRSVDGRLQSISINRQIQAVGMSSFGGFVERGFSGAPVFAKEMNAIIGMMSRIETPIETRLAFITAVDELAEVYRELDYEDRTSSREITRRVYVSCATPDRMLAQRITSEINLQGVQATLGHGDNQENYQEENDVQVRLSNAVIVVLTPNSVSDSSVNADWENALNNYIPVIPIVSEQVEVPTILQAFSPIPFYQGFRNGVLMLTQRISSIDETYLQFLSSLLRVWEKLRAESNSAYRFADKVARIREFIGSSTTNRYSPIDIMALQNNIDRFLDESKVLFPEKLIGEETTTRVVGLRLDDIKTFFRDRLTQQRELSRFILDDAYRVISIIGRGGIGKSSLVSKVMGEIESGENNYVRQDQIKGILYFSNRDQEITAERIYLAGAQLLGGAPEKRLRELWAKPLEKLEDKFRQFVNELRQDVYIVVLDNFEDLLDENSYLRDASLQMFLEAFLRGDHNTKLIITTREQVRLPETFMRYERRMIIVDGLPQQDALSMLSDLDINGDYGIREENHETLVELVEKVHGVPRALQVITSILAESPLLSLHDLLSQETLFMQDQFIENLVRENYRRMDTNSRHVMNVLAVFGSPVPAAAIGSVLRPFVPNLDVERTLKRLIMTHVVSVNRADKLVYLHPIDRDYIYEYLNYEYQKLIQTRSSGGDESGVFT